MKNRAVLVETLYEKVELYGKTSYELAKLKSLETSTKVVSSLITRISIILVFSLFAMVLNIGIALLLGDLLGKAYYGFFIVAAFYLLSGIVLQFFLHQWIAKPVGNLMIKQALQ